MVKFNDFTKHEQPDVLVSFSDINLFKSYKCNKKYLWSHSIQNLEKFIRKKQLFSYIKHKPIIILEGDYHYKNRSFLTSFYGKQILRLAPDYEFINEDVDINNIPSKKCIFTTKSDRNLDILLDAWDKIYLLNKDASLVINPPFKLLQDHLKKNISIRNKGAKSDLINELKSSKIMLVPGHKGEVFCLAAEEARELCIPIVTMGYGSLYERVQHNVTGFVAKDIDEFITYAHKLLNDNTVYLKFRKNLSSLRNSRNFKNVADDFLKIINNQN